METINFRLVYSENFSHIDNPNYITKEWDHILLLQIVLIKQVCWLQFTKKMPVSSSGKYYARLHMYLGEDTVWPLTADNHKTYIKIAEVLDEHKIVLVEENMSSNEWNVTITSRFNNKQLSNSSIFPDYQHRGWYFFKFKPFKVSENSNLEFKFADIENLGRKSKIKFNSIELIKLNVKNTSFRVVDSEDISHIENPHFVTKEWDESLQQEIVFVKQVSWLQFTKTMPVSSSGKYYARLHMYLGEDTVWPLTADNHKTYIIITEVLDEHKIVLIEENMSSNEWNATITSRFNNKQLSNSSIVPDYQHYGWYFFKFKPFKVSKNSNLEFKFADIENLWLKQKIKFNSIELIKLNVKNTSFRVVDSEDISHIDNPHYVIMEWDESLQQEIVFVKQVFWLQFTKKMPVSSSGKYYARLHMYLGEDTVWPLTADNHKTYIIITEVLDEHKIVLIEENISSNEWNATITSRFNNKQLSDISIVPDYQHRGWYFLKFKPFKVSKNSNLEFKFADIENLWLKQKIKFNSIELVKLNEKNISFRVVDSEDISHIENPHFVTKEWDESLQQEIVFVKQVSWLQFTKKMPVSTSGQYYARLHMYLGEDTVWPLTADNYKTYIIITEVLDEHKIVLIEENMSSNEWNAIITSRFNNKQLSNSSIIPDYQHRGWYFFKFKSFKVSENSNLEFEFADIENINWKYNIKFNYIELIKFS
ncbi:uncharacterized protein LOC136076858 [Hydra vulgaris]|uniref:Uncharacterized protein LOC136076858 n=1 Tax=Hydra vulgaris TaxID=6087 RepID=A0ABM4BC84_HYDVU